MIDSIFQVLGSGLKLWSSLESRRYLDKYISLRKDWYAEKSKPENEQNHAVLDNIKFELSLLCSGFSSSVEHENPANKPQSN